MVNTNHTSLLPANFLLGRTSKSIAYGHDFVQGCDYATLAKNEIKRKTQNPNGTLLTSPFLGETDYVPGQELLSPLNN